MGISIDTAGTQKTGNRQLDIIKKIQKFKDEFANATYAAATGRYQGPNSIFTSKDTGASTL